MSFDEAAKSELDNLLGLMGTEAFDAQAKQRLSLLVNQSEQARRIYLDHCQMQAMLRQSSLLATFSAERQAGRVVLPPGSSVGLIVKWAALAAAACILFAAGLAMSSHFQKVSHSNAVTIRSAVAIVEGIDGVPPIELPRFAGPSLEGLDVPVAYIDAVRESSPAHYWRFEEANDNQVVDAVGDATAVLMDGARLHNGSLYFPRGRRNHGFAFVDEPIPTLLNAEFTIEVWAKASFSHRSTLVDINHREPASKFREKLYRIAFLPSLETIYPGETIRFIGQLWPYGEQEAVSVFSADRYRPGSWHHLVAVRRTDRLELYFDGKPANAVPAPPLTSDPLSPTITIGRFSGPQERGAKPDRAFFKGLVDEVAIYPSALSADEVAEHYRLMQVK